MEKKLVTEMVIKNLEKQGRKKGWLKDQLKITYPTLKDRFNRHNWTVDDEFELDRLGLI